MSEEKPPIPIEIPWKLASTTQPLTDGEPNQTSISMFVFEPDEDKLTGEFPRERLIYLKFTVTVSPASFPDTQPGTALGEGVPCFHLLLDLKVSKEDGGTGKIRPYFHSAAPLHRTMIETGVVGVEVFEGESDQEFMGKSGSQMYESSSSQSRTTSKGAGATAIVPIPIINVPAIISGSVRSTSTDVSAQRGISQVVDTTQRQASEERRELTSHSMKVENVLSLLNAKYVGTPYLRFSLSPQPLHLLSVDTSDPNIWFSQLLQRRSSGIEGIQEFTTVLLVPKGQDFCVNAKLLRVCMLDNPPGPLTYDELYIDSPQQRIRLLNYLNQTYPPGTPLDDLDIDISGILFPPPDATDPLIRPTIDRWFITFVGSIVWATVDSPSKRWPFGLRAVSNYKHAQEVWLETLRDEYQREVARSPLERGVLLGDQLVLDTCFSFHDHGGISVGSSNSSATSISRIPFDLSNIDFGGISSTASSTGKSVRELAFEAVTRWNLLENRIAIVLGNQREVSGSDFRFDDKQIVSLVIDRWAKLPAENKNNISFQEAMKIMQFSENYRRLLKEAGVTDLKSMAQAIKSASELEKYNAKDIDYESLISSRKTTAKDKARAHKFLKTLIKPMKFPISSEVSERMQEDIGKALQHNFTSYSEK
jgi:hypothetical protein